MKQFFGILGNCIFGIAFSMMFFLVTFEPKELIQYVGLIVGLGAAFAVSKINTDETNKLKDEIYKLKDEIYKHKDEIEKLKSKSKN